METNCQSNDGCRSVFSVWTEGKNATLRQYYNRKWHRLSRTRFLNIYPSRFYFFEICMIKSRNVRIFSKIWLYTRDREGWTRYSSCKFHLGTAVGQGDLRSVLGEGEFKLNQNLNVNRLNENS